MLVLSSLLRLDECGLTGWPAEAVLAGCGCAALIIYSKQGFRGAKKVALEAEVKEVCKVLKKSARDSKSSKLTSSATKGRTLKPQG